MTYEWDDVLIVGDSFCADRTEKSDWPNIFASSITGQSFQTTQRVRGEGYRGASWWSARKKLLAELEHSPAKVLVFCHTEPYRLPNDQGLGINTLSVETKIVATPLGVDKPSENFIKAARSYYEYIISEDYHLWAYQQWFQEIDQIIVKNNIEKVVHFFCFRGFYTNHTFAKGVTIETPLIELQQHSALWKKNDTRNHFSPVHNLEFGDRLATIIKNYPGDGVRLNIKLIGK
jgi:hypothetical protein